MSSKQLLSLIVLAVCALPALAADLVVSDGWVRESIPGRTITAAYMRIGNSGAEDCELATVTTEAAARVEVHEHTHSNGKMQMRQLETLILPSASSLTFNPGGLHLMLFDVRQPLRAGETLTFTFDAGPCGKVDAEFEVKGPQ